MASLSCRNYRPQIKWGAPKTKQFIKDVVLVIICSTKIRGCYSIVQFASGEEQFGAIAGEGNLADGKIDGNYYVDEGTAAIGGVSHSKCAE